MARKEQAIDNPELRRSGMMSHLLDALDAGTDIGHYGRLTFTMVARYFMGEDELVGLLSKQPSVSQADAESLVQQVKEYDYNPPKREKVLEWQAEQDFSICPNPDDPDACNVYEELRFPDDVYQRIGAFREKQARSKEGQ